MVAISGTLSNWMYNNKAYSVEGSLPFELGKTYKRRDGKDVTIIKVINHRGYETVQGDDGDHPQSGYRYNRDTDRGRCTGTAGDFSDPCNLLPEFPADHPTKGEGFFVPVSLMGQIRSAEERALFRQLLVLEHRISDAKYGCFNTQDWKGTFDMIFKRGLSRRAGQLIRKLNLSLDFNPRSASNYKHNVMDFEWALTQLVEDRRPFYAI